MRLSLIFSRKKNHVLKSNFVRCYAFQSVFYLLFIVILIYNIYVVFFISGFGAGNISILCVLTLGRFGLYYKAHLYYILYN